MSEYDQGTLQGFALADEGMRRAMDHADRDEANWSDQVRGFLAGFILRVPYFTSEDVWVEAEKAGIAAPPDRRAYGGVIKGFLKRGLIRRVGAGASRIARLHGNHVTVYERV